MSYKEIYQEMRNRNEEKIRKEGVKVDSLIAGSTVDLRHGIGLFCLGEFVLNQNFKKVTTEVKEFFPEQVIYEPHQEDFRFREKTPVYGILHHTFFQLAKVDGLPDEGISKATLRRYCEIAAEELFTLGSYSIQYDGLIAVPTGLVICGFPDKDINVSRSMMRKRMLEEHLYFAEPYIADTAHSTLMRLCKKEDGSKLLNFAAEYSRIDLGTLQVKSLHLMYGSWRMWPQETQLVADFDLVHKKVRFAEKGI